MKKIASVALAALTVAGAGLAAGSASAAPWRDYHHGYRHGGGWARPVYGVGFARPYYFGPVGYACTSHWRWDGWGRRYVLVRSCY